MEDYENVLLVKTEVFVFKIPPRTTNRGYRAADWNLAVPEWTGRLRVVVKGEECTIKLEDKISGELFAKSPIDQYPGTAIEAVSDSSRYFVIRIQDDNGRSAFIGIGFTDRSDSFDLNVALQDHFKWKKKSEEFEKEDAAEPAAKLDLGFKEGETIKINMRIGKKEGSDSTPRPKPKGAAIGLLPPPGSVKLAPPPITTKTPEQAGLLDLDDHVGDHASASGNHDHVGDHASASGNQDWGDFASADPSNKTVNNTNWVQF